ncbi:MAG: beta strand repeat-containing protein, partial [Isosphaerales bacterium]
MFRARRRRTELADCRRARFWRSALSLETLEPRRLLSSFLVDSTADSGPGSLRAAMVAANADPSPGTDNIFFDIPASTAPLQNVPVPGFDPGTQTWTIALDSPLPTITRSVSIDGYTQAHFPISYLYPASISSAVQTVSVLGSPTGGNFTLTTSAPLPVGTTAPIAYTADAGTVQNALGAIIGAGNVAVTGGPLPNGSLTITFQGADAGQAIPDLSVTNNNLTGGISPSVLVTSATVGGVAGLPTLISSVPNNVAALDGNNAQVRVIVDGSKISSGPLDIGFVIDASNSILRGLAIEGFGVGVSVPNTTDVGDLIQGNFIGVYVTYPVDPQTGIPLPSPDTVVLARLGNTQQGVVLDSKNTTVGGTEPQDNNVISGNGAQGVLLQPGASGNQVLGNQIGVVGPIIGYYYQVGNGAEGVLIESSGNAGNPSSIVYSSSNIIGGAVAGAGNVISANSSYGVHIVGVGATRNLVEANYIGAAPGGGYVFGSGDPGNQADGVWIDDAPDNQVGGPAASDGNVISSNQGDGVDITGSDGLGNTVLNNIIGLTVGGSAVLGNDLAGVANYSAGTAVGPGNVISANLIGVLISGATATNVTVIGNLIGTDASGEADLGNARAGVEIDSATGVIVEGNGQGSQVISGNLVGVSINGPSATGILIAGNFIGTDKSGTADRGNSNEGVLIEGASGNTVGGTVSGAGNVISTNHWGIRLDGSTAINNLIEGNDVGTDVTGTAPLGNEVNGIIISNDASDNSIGGTGGGQGNTIAFNVAAGVSVQSGAGNSILSNSIFSNGHLGIELLGTGNDSQNAPSISGASGGGTGSNIQGSLTSVANTSFLIQFFSNIAPDASGFGQGQTFLGSTPVMTNASGSATINFNLSNGLAVGAWVTVTATNQSTGDTSAFSNAISAQPVSVAFSMADFPVGSTDGSVMVDIQRTGNLSVAVSVSYATSNGSAIAGQDYTATAGTLTFPPSQTDLTFSVPILANPGRSNPSSFFNLTLSQPVGGATLGTISSATVTIANQSNPTFKTFLVVNTNDSGPGSLRDAITAANADSSPGTDNIVFDIPASTAPNLDVPVSGFHSDTQTWTITLNSALPTITHSVIIDGYSQAHVGVPFRYPTDFSSQLDVLAVGALVTGGTYQLTVANYTDRDGTARGGTTGDIPYNATAAVVQNQLENLVGFGYVAVIGPSQAAGPGVYGITFQGESTGLAINLQVVLPTNLTGTNPGATVDVSTQGGNPNGNPFEITTTPNSTAATAGNNARVGVIIDGSNLPSGAIGFQIEASSAALRGLIIDGFDVGVEISSPLYPGPADFSGNLIQGDFIGQYLVYPVDPITGTPLPAPNSEELAGQGNGQGVVIDGYGTNTTLGGASPQDDDVIAGNRTQGVEVASGADGNQVLGNEIGVIGPSNAGVYWDVPNGAQGILIESSSNLIGVAGAGNIISANAGDGVEIDGTGATQNLVAGNLIGTGPGGGYIFGTGNPGNRGDGVDIQDAPDNIIGGDSTAQGNTISSNAGAGVFITGASASSNVVSNNIIGLTSDGSQVLGNAEQGVAVDSPGTQVGPGNVISANLIGVLVSGPNATGVTVAGNLIGTDITGKLDLGNEDQGVLIDLAAGVVVQGNAAGSQVISGNNVGVEIEGQSATGNLVQGNLVGTDKTGTLALPNSQQGVLVEDAPANTIGGSVAASRNVISANFWGVQIDGATATGNLVAGNAIGTDVSGTLPLGNETQGIIFSSNASNNTIGGTAAGQGNTIAFNVAAGVSVQSGTGNTIQSNSIFSNGHLGIELLGTGNDSQSAPSLSGATGGGTSSNIQGSLTSVLNTSFLIQFFSNIAPDPSGFGQGQTFLGSTTVMTNASGSATINFNLSNGLTDGAWLTATATNLITGDTSAFSNANSAQPVSVAFSMADFMVTSTNMTTFATIDVLRAGNISVAVSVSYATSNGSAIAGQDYSPVSGTLTFPPNQTDEMFQVPILANSNRSTPSSFVNLTLSQPVGGATLGSISSATVTIANQSNHTFKTFFVVNTDDSGMGSLRDAITAANADSSPGTDNIVFDIPTSTAPNLDVPVSGFHSATQTWTITLASALPTITHSVIIDGYSQAHVGVAFRYPTDFTSQSDLLDVGPLVTGGTYQLTVASYTDRSGMLQPGIKMTGDIPYNATAAFVQNQLENLVGFGNVAVIGPSQAAGPGVYTITFQGESTGLEINMQVVSPTNLTGTNPVATLDVVIQGGNPSANLSEITTTPNSTAATAGNNARVGVIIDGSQIPSGPADIGFVIDASNSILRGLAIGGFSVGVSVPNPTDVGDLVQGNSIGEYLSYPVDHLTGAPLPAPNNVVPVALGNTQQGVVLGSRNATLGGTDPQAANIIGANGAQGVLIEPGASGNQVLGNQIGVVGPSSSGFYFQAGNGAEGVLIQSSGNAGDQSSIVYASSNIIGGAAGGAGNIISANHTYGVHIAGVGATRNLVEANYIGVAPGGGLLFGQSAPGNLADGVWIDNAQYNQIGGGSASVGNVISSNGRAGVNITGPYGIGNTVLNNIIGLTSAGNVALGNNQAGVADSAPGTVIGPGNVISANLMGVLISGSAATNVTVIGNLIGTDLTGEADLGNAEQGVEIDSATGAIVEGNGQGSQVISGNLVGVEIDGATSTVQTLSILGLPTGGTFTLTTSAPLPVGTTAAIPYNADAGTVQDALGAIIGAGNVVVTGGPLPSGSLTITFQGADAQIAIPTLFATNSLTGEVSPSVEIATSTQNLVEGNFIGTDKAGTADRGNSNEGVLIEGASGNNTIGGVLSTARNVISTNQWGIRVDGSSATANLIEGNFIGTDSTGIAPLGNEINGVIISNNASNNTIGGTVSGQGNTIAFNVAAGVSVQSGTGDAILSNSIFSNGHLGIDLVAPGDPASGVTPNQPGMRTGPNNLQNYPVMVAASGGPIGSAQGTLNSLPNTRFLIQFFSSVEKDPSGYGQGQTLLLPSQMVTTDSNGNANININPDGGLPANGWITATATNLGSGDTSEFSNAIEAQAVSVAFAMASYTVESTAGTAAISVLRTGNPNATVSVNYATSDGTALAGRDYTAASGTLSFLPGQLQESFNVTILPHDRSLIATTTTVNLTLSQPTGGATLGSISTA